MEKRKERRFKQWNKTSIKSASGPREFNDPAGINASTYDLSLGGAKLYSDVDFPVGTAIRLHVEMVRSKDLLRLDGVVRWARKDEECGMFELGVEFFHLIPKTALALMENLFDLTSGIPTKVFEGRGHGNREEG